MMMLFTSSIYHLSGRKSVFLVFYTFESPNETFRMESYLVSTLAVKITGEFCSVVNRANRFRHRFRHRYIKHFLGKEVKITESENWNITRLFLTQISLIEACNFPFRIDKVFKPERKKAG